MDTNANSSNKKYYDANNFTVNGRLTKDPEVRTSPSGNSYAIISIANNRGDSTNFFTFFASAAQIPFVQTSLRKGCAVDVSGTILPQTEAGPDGKNITVYKLIATKFALIANPRTTATGTPNNAIPEQPMNTAPAPQRNNYQQPNYGGNQGYNNQPQSQPYSAPQNAPQQVQYQQNNGYNGGYSAPATPNYNSDDDLPF